LLADVALIQGLKNLVFCHVSHNGNKEKYACP
jgi:hypothetical protein